MWPLDLSLNSADMRADYTLMGSGKCKMRELAVYSIDFPANSIVELSARASAWD